MSACASSLPAPQARSGISTKSDPNAKGFGRRRALTCHRGDGRGSRPSCSAAHFYLSSRAHPSKASSLFEAVWKFWQRHFSKSWYKCGKIADVRFSRFLGHFYMHSVLKLSAAEESGSLSSFSLVRMRMFLILDFSPTLTSALLRPNRLLRRIRPTSWCVCPLHCQCCLGVAPQGAGRPGARGCRNLHVWCV